MRLQFLGMNLELSGAFASHASARMHRALSRFASRVGAATMRVFDRNGPRGGEDMVCRIEASVRGAGVIVVEAVDRDAYAAVDQATDRLRRAVARRLGRGVAMAA